MKSIFYVSAALMIIAAIYGFADFRKTKNDKAFRSLYNKTGETASKDIKPAEIVPEPMAVPETKKEAVTEKQETASEKAVEKTSAIQIKTGKKSRDKKLQTKFFSRAALEKFEKIPVIKDAEPQK